MSPCWRAWWKRGASVGGDGGNGGVMQATPGQTCAAGKAGADGVVGQKGSGGSDGPYGPRAQILTVSRAEVYGSQISPQLRQLIDYTNGRR